MASFDEVQFPPSISFGATGGPGFSTKVIILSSGYEARNQNWSLARAAYDISTGIKTRADMDAVIAFFYARRASSRLPLQGLERLSGDERAGRLNRRRQFSISEALHLRLNYLRPDDHEAGNRYGNARRWRLARLHDWHYIRRRRRQRDVSIRRSGSLR